MSIWDNMKKFAQPYNDDEFDDFDDYDDDYEDTEEEPALRSRRSSSRGSEAPKNTRRAPERRSEPKEEPQMDEEEFEDDYDTAFNSVPKTPAAATPAASAASGSFSGKVMSMNRNSSQELVRYHPSSFADSKKAAKDLISSKAVILNLEGVDKDTSRRMVDFLSGVVFAMDGDVQKVAMSTYVFCPPNVFITGGPETVEAAVEETV